MTDLAHLAPALDRGLVALGLDLPAPARRDLLAYLGLLARWNRSYNLTAVREPAQMLVRHVLDSLAILPHLHARRLADVGAGPGLPGLVLAIARPDLEVLSIDSNGKMARFQREALRQLGLGGRCRVEQARVEEVVADPPWDTVTARAFASLGEFVRASAHLLAPDGRWLAMKGRRPDDEIAALPPGIRVEAVLPLQVPDLAEQRHAIIMAGPSTQPAA